MLSLLNERFAPEQALALQNALKQVKEIQTESKLFNYDFSYGMLDTLLHVMADFHTMLAAIYYPFVKEQKVDLATLQDKEVVEILTSVLTIEQLKINTIESQTQNIKNMFIALAKDIRVIILLLTTVMQKVKMLDKLAKPEQATLMHQVKEIYAPLAAMISIGYIKSTLENEVFLYYKPVEYAQLNKQLHQYVEDRNNQITLSIENIKKEIVPIEAQVYGRQKQISSIYKKLQSKNAELNQIYDILAIRVIVATVEECYTVLGKIHALYKPLGRFKDYIAQPKENGYQSLHTTVIVENGDPLEIQIRTTDMHTYAEYGFAAHWAYKEKRKVNESDKKISYIRSIMEMYKEKTPEELLDALKIDVYSGNIFCQTPKGKILQFPEGATPVDFAYAIHSKVGDMCVGAKVNDKMVPINTMLKNGDVIEIITNPNSKGPSRDWLKLAKTSEARNKINAFFKKEMKDENIKKGKSILEAQAKAKNINLSRLMTDELLEGVYEKYSLTSLDDMYASIGYNGLSAGQVLSRLTNLYNETKREEDPAALAPQVVATPVLEQKNNAVNVLGFSNLMVKFAKCCSPLPGDDIIGYVSRGKGVTVHRKDCESIKHNEFERTIECSWNDSATETFVGSVTIVALNSPNSIATISRKIGDMKLNITTMKTSLQNKEQMSIWLGVVVKNKEDLNDLMTKIKNLSCVIDVYRSM